MKRRAGAGLALVLAILAFYNLQLAAWQQWQPPPFIREQPPEKGAAGAEFYYDSDMNPFYPDLAPYSKKEAGYVTGNCTWYAWGRACEIVGEKLPYAFTGNAGTWWNQNKEQGWYPYGHEAKRGAIACYETHVAVVEQADPLMVSESGWNVEKQKEAIAFHCGTPWHEGEAVVGYLYVGETASD